MTHINIILHNTYIKALKSLGWLYPDQNKTLKGVIVIIPTLKLRKFGIGETKIYILVKPDKHLNTLKGITLGQRYTDNNNRLIIISE